jgi:hypothetical protein
MLLHWEVFLHVSVDSQEVYLISANNDTDFVNLRVVLCIRSTFLLVSFIKRTSPSRQTYIPNFVFVVVVMPFFFRKIK